MDLIKANKNKYFEYFFSKYNKFILSRHFHNIYLKSVDIDFHHSGSTIIFANHSNWWDGLVAYYLSYNLWKCDAYLMMDEEQMSKYPFFKMIGAFSVNRKSYRESYNSILYAIELLMKKEKVLWIFPQGKMRPSNTRPLKFEKGILKIIENVPDLKIFSLTFNYEFLMEQFPEIFISIQRYKNSTANIENFQCILQNQLDNQVHVIINGELEDYKNILQGRKSRNKLVDKIYG